MQLVEHDALERGEQERRIVGRQQQRQLLGRGQQDVRRIAALPLPPRHRRVAGAGLDLDRQPHLGDRRLQIARDVDRERLERRDVERVQAAAALHAAPGGDDATARARPPRAASRGQLHQGRQKSRQRLAGAGRRDQQRRAVLARLGQQRQLMLARRPAARGEPFWKRSGSSAAGSAGDSDRGRGGTPQELSRRAPFRRGQAEKCRAQAGPTCSSSPRPACGERSKFAREFRVRGTSPRAELLERAPHPDPLPVRTGRGRRKAAIPSPACRKCPSPGR